MKNIIFNCNKVGHFLICSVLFFGLFSANLNLQAQTYNYDQSGKVIGVTYSDGQEISYEYDENGNLLAVTNSAQVDNSIQEQLPDDAIPDNEPEDDPPTDDCFIATAAYGSLFESHVKTLRQFRDNYLLTNEIGTRLVNFYYQTSPPVADYIRERPELRAAVRGVLTPVVYSIEKPFSVVLGLTLLISLWLSRRFWIVKFKKAIHNCNP